MIRKIGTGETGAPLVQAELNVTEKVALLNILTLFDHYLPESGLAGTRDALDAELMVKAIREAFCLDADPASLSAEAVIRADERRKCAAEIRADAATIDRGLVPLVHAATLDAADVIDPDAPDRTRTFSRTRKS